MTVTNFTVPPTSLDNAHTVAVAIPTTANAQAAAIWPYRNVSAPVNGSMSLVHTNNSQTDKTYKLILIG